MPLIAAGFWSQLCWAQTVNRHQEKSMTGKVRKKRKPVRRRRATARPRDENLEIVEQLLALALEAIARKTPEVRLADVLKLMEFKLKLQPQADARKIFWEWIERFRREAYGSEDDHPPAGER